MDDAERQRLLATLHEPEFADQPPYEVFPVLLARGIYLGSIRTMYRVLAAAGETAERRAQRPPQAHPVPSLTATGPNQVWTWDITKLATLEKGVFLMAYVIIDLFSRYVVGWMVAPKECKTLAAQLFSEAITRHGVSPGLVVHADRGSAMKSDTLAQLLATLGVTRSFSRPRVSNDNAFSEAQFKTLKYQPDYPGRFSSEFHARGWLQDFFGWHNEAHHHSGLALFTPSDVFHGRVSEVLAVRQATMDAACLAHPERFPNGPPVVRRPPDAVHINPITSPVISIAELPRNLSQAGLPVVRPPADEEVYERGSSKTPPGEEHATSEALVNQGLDEVRGDVHSRARPLGDPAINLDWVTTSALSTSAEERPMLQ